MPAQCRVHPLLVLASAVTFTVASCLVPPAKGPGVTAGTWSEIDQAVLKAMDRGQVPGAVVLVGQDDRVVFEKAYGHRSVAPGVEPMTLGTRFDLASLTKVVATAPAVMRLVQAGKVRLDDPVVRHLPRFGLGGKEGITIRQVLTHYAGLAPFFRLSREDLADPERILNRIYRSGPSARPGTRFIYSDLGFILLGRLIEVVSGERLDRFVQSRIFAPLRMTETHFGPGPGDLRSTAPTERQADGTILRGQVHDPLSSMMGGVAGHAGLFSTARDLARYCRMLLNQGSLDDARVLDPEMVRQMVSTQSPPDEPNIRGLGWDIQSVYSSVKGDHFSPASYGHTGFTGTSLWIDPEIRAYLILLTSRLHPEGRGDVRPLRKAIANIVGSALSPGTDAASRDSEPGRFSP